MSYHFHQLTSTPTAACSTTNTHLTAILAAFGVPWWTQNTHHVAPDQSHWTWHLAPQSITDSNFPDVAQVIARYQPGGTPYKLDETRPLTDYPLHIALCMDVLNGRKLILAHKGPDRLPIHSIRTKQGYSRIIRAQEATADRDLIAITKAARGSRETVNHMKLIYAAQAFGFPILGTTPEGGHILPRLSVTDPRLSLDLIRTATAEITAYQKAAATASTNHTAAPPPPHCNLPGFPPGLHPYQSAISALYALEALTAVYKTTTPTLFLQNKNRPQRSALIDCNSSDLAKAIAHTGVKI